jgi:hypothetical protein
MPLNSPKAHGNFPQTQGQPARIAAGVISLTGVGVVGPGSRRQNAVKSPADTGLGLEYLGILVGTRAGPMGGSKWDRWREGS